MAEVSAAHYGACPRNEVSAGQSQPEQLWRNPAGWDRGSCSWYTSVPLVSRSLFAASLEPLGRFLAARRCLVATPPISLKEAGRIKEAMMVFFSRLSRYVLHR